MSFIDSYEQQLVAAATRQRDQRIGSRLRRRLATPRRRLAAAAFAVLLIGAPAGAATVVWNPFGDSSTAPRPSTEPLDPASLARFGVFRRAQTDADRAALTPKVVQAFRAPGFDGVKLNAIRLVDPDRGVLLVPFDTTAGSRDPAGRPIPGLDPARFRNGLCLYLPLSVGAQISCHPLAQIEAGRGISSSEGLENGLVPDGVSQVRLIRGDSTVVAGVHDNYFSARSPHPRFVEWLDAGGEVIRRFDLGAPIPGP